jgi:hypothetical protein
MSDIFVMKMFNNVIIKRIKISLQLIENIPPSVTFLSFGGTVWISSICHKWIASCLLHQYISRGADVAFLTAHPVTFFLDLAV